MLNMKKILLTGGTGFIGSNILRDIAKYYDVTILIRNKRILKANKKIKYLYFNGPENLSNLLKKRKFEVIIHCATYYKKSHVENDIKKMIDANIYIGSIILENYKKIRFTKFINFTSVWENFDGIKNNPPNLYAALKLSFSNIIKFYKKEYKDVSFYNLYLSETFGQEDIRGKILPTLKSNYNKDLTTTINSKNLSVNIINIKDIILALKLILHKKTKSGNYAIINKKSFGIYDLISKFNKVKKKKIKLKWKSKKIIKEKMIAYKKVPGWKPRFSSINDLIKYIDS